MTGSPAGPAMSSPFAKCLAGAQFVLPVLALAGLLLGFVSFFGSGYVAARNILLDSDALYPSALYRDFMRGADLSNWVLSSGAYWFPDYPQYFLVRYLAGSAQVAAMIYAVLNVLLMTVSLIVLARQIITGFHAAHAALLVSLSTLFVLFNPMWIVQTNMFFATVHHGGALIAMPLTLALAIRLTLRPSTRTTWMLAGGTLAALSLLMTASDLMFVIQVLVPLAPALLIPFLWMPACRRRIASVLILLAGASAAGFVLDRISRGRADNVMVLFAPDRALASFSVLAAAPAAEVLSNPAHLLLLGVFLALSLMVLVWQGWRLARYPERARPAVAVFAAFCLALFVANVAFVGGTGIAQDLWALRYFLPLLVLSTGYGFFFLLTPLHGRALWQRTIMLAFSCVVLLSAFIPFVQRTASFDQLAREANYYPPEVACLDTQLRSHHVTQGVATYWQARPITEFSRANLTLAQVHSDLSPFPWVNSLESYYVEPQFIVLDMSPGLNPEFSIDEAAVRQRFGPPADVVDCGNSRALVYGRPDDTALRNLFAGAFAVR